MAKCTIKTAIPIILVGIFAIVIFIAIDYGQLESSFYLVILFLVIFVFSFGLAMGQNLTSPVKKILGKATELSEGNLSSRIYLETNDELSELAEIFNKMAEELEASQEQQANIDKSVGIKVKARTKELEETIDALNKSHEAVKNKETEIAQLKEELNNLGSKTPRHKSRKT
jgi:nitrogen fixation/metabolism regulation signal transduction histidine kinase